MIINKKIILLYPEKVIAELQRLDDLITREFMIFNQTRFDKSIKNHLKAGRNILRYFKAKLSIYKKVCFWKN